MKVQALPPSSSGRYSDAVPAKLMKNRPSEVQEEPHHGRTAIAVSLIALALLTVVGLFLAIGTGASNSDEASDVTLESWAANASEACTRVAHDHPALLARAKVRPDPQRAHDVSAGVAALSSAIESVVPPSSAGDAVSVAEVVQLGEHASDTWATIADEARASEEVAAAVDLVDAYVTGLNGLGADCSTLSQ